MNKCSKWALAVALSLLYHLVLIALITQHLSVQNTDHLPVQSITVELLGKTPELAIRSRSQKPQPVVTEKSIQAPAKVEQSIPIKTDTKPQKISADTEQTDLNTKIIKDTSENNHPNLDIQTLNKSTRPPTFLRKIEPIYPGAEKRAGRQAYVLAEVTIDNKGNVLVARIVQSGGNNFDNAVISALKTSVFVPGYIDTEAVAVRFLVPFRFDIKN